MKLLTQFVLFITLTFVVLPLAIAKDSFKAECGAKFVTTFEAGKIAFQQGDIETAIICWEETVKQFPTSPRRYSTDYIDLLRRLAIAYQSLGYLYKARNTLYCALFYAQIPTQRETQSEIKIKEKLKDYIISLVGIFIQMSEVYRQMGDFLKDENEKNQDLVTINCHSPIQLTREIYQKALEKEKEIPITNFKRASYYLDMAEEIAPENSWLQASILNQRGNILMTEQKKYIEAFSLYRKNYIKALSKYRKAAEKTGKENKKLMVKISLNIARLHAEVLSIYKKIIRQKADIWNDDNFLNALDDCINVRPEGCKKQNDDKSSDLVKSIENIKQNIQNEVKTSLILHKFNNQVENQSWMIKTLIALLSHSSVKQYLDDLDKVLKKSDRKNLKILREHVSNQIEQGIINKQIEKALEIALLNSLEEALENLNKLPASHEKSFDLMSIAYFAENLQVEPASFCPQQLDWTEKEIRFRVKPLEQALKLVEDPHDPIAQSHAKSYLAKLYADKQCYAQAIEMTKEAISKLPQNKTDKAYVFRSRPELLFRWYKQLGDFLLAKNARQQPPSDFEDLQQIQQPIKRSFCQTYSNKIEKPWLAYKCANEYLQQVDQHYRCGIEPLVSAEQFRVEQIRLFFQWAFSAKEKNKPIFLTQAREHLEKFKIIELRNYFQDNCITKPVNTNNFDQVFSNHFRTAILYTFSDKEKDTIQLLLNFENHMELFPLENIKLRDLIRQVNQIREEMKRIGVFIEGKDGEIAKFIKKQIRKLQKELLPLDVTGGKLISLFKRCQEEMKKGEVTKKKLADFIEEDFTKEQVRKLQEFCIHLDQDIRKLRTDLYLKNRHEQLIQDLASLYDAIFKPLETELFPKTKLFPTTKNLIIVPDGILRTLPFAALYDNQGEKFLIEKVALVIEPAIKLVNIGKPSVQLEQKPALLSAIPEFKDHLYPVSCALLGKVTPCVGKGVELLKGEAFTMANIEKKFQKAYAILHFSTHGKFDSNPNESYLEAYDPERIGIKQFRQLLEKISKPVDLLTFSACETLLGNERAALGLTGVAVQTHVHSAVGTLWQVRADSTKKLITDFYQTWRNHKKKVFSNKAEALQQVQIKFLSNKNTEEDFSHPYFWAPFVLVGNWL